MRVKIRAVMGIQILWLVPGFGGWSLDTDPNFGRYRHFCGTIVNVRNYKNPDKKGYAELVQTRMYCYGWVFFLKRFLRCFLDPSVSTDSPLGLRSYYNPLTTE